MTWLGDEEKMILDLAPRSRVVLEDHKPQAHEITVEKGMAASMKEQILKGWRI